MMDFEYFLNWKLEIYGRCIKRESWIKKLTTGSMKPSNFLSTLYHEYQQNYWIKKSSFNLNPRIFLFTKYSKWRDPDSYLNHGAQNTPKLETKYSVRHFSQYSCWCFSTYRQINFPKLLFQLILVIPCSTSLRNS